MRKSPSLSMDFYSSQDSSFSAVSYSLQHSCATFQSIVQKDSLLSAKLLSIPSTEIFAVLMTMSYYAYLAIYLPQHSSRRYPRLLLLLGQLYWPFDNSFTSRCSYRSSEHILTYLSYNWSRYLFLMLFYIFSLRWVLLRRHPLFRSHFKSLLSTMHKWDLVLCLSTLFFLIEVYISSFSS